MSPKRPCSICTGPRESDYAYCRECRNTYRRQTRPAYRDLTEAEKVKARCRAYTNVLLARGLLRKENCPCGSPDVEAHHLDYGDPRSVQWLCRECRAEKLGNVKRSMPQTYVEPRFANLSDVLKKWC